MSEAIAKYHPYLLISLSLIAGMLTCVFIY